MSKTRVLLTVGRLNNAIKITEALTEKNYIVDTASYGSMGKLFFGSRGYKLVVIDYQLPDMGGYELYDYIREHDRTMPVIMLEAENKIGFDVSDDNNLFCCADINDITMCAKQATRVAAPVTADMLEAGDIVLNLENRMVKHCGKPVPTTKNEFLLLEYLMRNKNRIVSRAEILSSIWGDNFFKKDITLTTCLNSLRKKIEYGHLPKRIYTVTKRGYMLI